MKLAEGVDLQVVAARTTGFAGADLANLVNEATLLAARSNEQTCRWPISRKQSTASWRD